MSPAQRGQQYGAVRIARPLLREKIHNIFTLYLLSRPFSPLAIAAATSQFFFCTDRYSWEWSQDVSQLPNQASDSLCITIDSDIVDGLNTSESQVIHFLGLFSFLDCTIQVALT